MGWETSLTDRKRASRIELIDALPALGDVVTFSQTLDDLPPALNDPTFDRTSAQVQLPGEDCNGTPYNMMVLELQSQ
ncbi:MAG: hypothetical protein AAF602_01985, partial [Myxococcota bacterium]